MDKEISLQLSTEEINLILEGLGTLPFVKVYGLIGKIQQQAAQQLQAPTEPAELAELVEE